MARYDQGWGRPGGQYGYERGWGLPPQQGGGPRRGYDGGYGAFRGPHGGGMHGDFRPHPGWGGGQHAGIDRARSEDDLGLPGEPGGMEEEGTTAVYGPARYGLGPYHARLHSRRRPDDELREEVQEALFYDTWVDADAITVEVSDGVVTLRGELPDYDEIRYATDDAWDVEGVRGVRCELSVRGSGSGSASAGRTSTSTGRGQQTPASVPEDE